MWWHFMLLFVLVKAFVLFKEESGVVVFDKLVVITENRWNRPEIDEIWVPVTNLKDNSTNGWNIYREGTEGMHSAMLWEGEIPTLTSENWSDIYI